jgi:hypothetical protein
VIPSAAAPSMGSSWQPPTDLTLRPSRIRTCARGSGGGAPSCWCTCPDQRKRSARWHRERISIAGRSRRRESRAAPWQLLLVSVHTAGASSLGGVVDLVQLRPAVARPAGPLAPSGASLVALLLAAWIRAGSPCRRYALAVRRRARPVSLCRGRVAMVRTEFRLPDAGRVILNPRMRRARC